MTPAYRPALADIASNMQKKLLLSAQSMIIQKLLLFDFEVSFV